MCMSVLSIYLSMYHMCSYGWQRPKEGIGFLGTRVSVGCELRYLSWEFLQKNSCFLHSWTFSPVLGLTGF